MTIWISLFQINFESLLGNQHGIQRTLPYVCCFVNFFFRLQIPCAFIFYSHLTSSEI